MKQLIVSVAGGFSVKIATLQTRLAFRSLSIIYTHKYNTRRPIHMKYIGMDRVKDELIRTSW